MGRQLSPKGRAKGLVLVPASLYFTECACSDNAHYEGSCGYLCVSYEDRTILADRNEEEGNG